MAMAEWQRVVDDLTLKIGSGEYPPGSRLPTMPQLRRDYGVGQKTVQYALWTLVREQLIEYRRGVGYFVVGPRPLDPAPNWDG